MPSGELAAMVLGPSATVTKTPFPNAMLRQLEALGRVRAVQEMPSGEVAAAVEPYATDTKTLFPNAIDCQSAKVGNVRAVHVIPSGEVAALVLGPKATAVKTPFP